MVTLNPEVSDKIFNDWVKGYAGRQRPVCVECSKKKGKVVAMKAGSSPANRNLLLLPRTRL